MRSLSEAQWDRYFELIEQLQKLPPDQRRDVLLGMTADNDMREILSLVLLRLGLAPELDRERSGERIGSYELGDRIGSGGMGVVYRAVQAFGDGIEREVAVKLIHPALMLNEPAEALARFQTEIGNLVKLEHRNIARVYDGGIYRDPETGEETPFLATELITGASLVDYAAKNKAGLGTIGILKLFLCVCDAIEYVHRRGMLHRDLKPANILVDALGEPKIIDFGLALVYGGAPDCDRSEGLSGTPAYMSPEQLSGALMTPASDVYTLGIILHELLTGHRPEASTDFLSSYSQVLKDTIARATVEDRAERYSSVADLKKDLRHCLAAECVRQEHTLKHCQILLRKVRRFWIEDVLENSLHCQNPVEVRLERQPEAVEQPWELIVQQPGQEPGTLPPSSQIERIFERFDRTLLILGEPGTGKTTLLLQLAQALLDDAERDERLPIPVVFHLSTWAGTTSSLIDWLLDELDKRYDVPQSVGRALLRAERLILLLDGLDELAPAHRVRCVQAINAFRRRHRLTGFAVCSRTSDYDALAVRVQLVGAVLLKSLAPRQIDEYLDCVPALAGLRVALAKDAKLYGLLQTPLMLGIAAAAYSRCPTSAIRMDGAMQEQPTRLFAVYIDAMFKRRRKSTHYTPEQSIAWLSWLAATLVRQNQSVFYLEWMQPDWLPSRTQQWLVSVGSVALCGLLYGLLLGLFSDHSWPVMPGLGLACGLAFGIAGYGDEIRPITRLRWSWSTLRENALAKLAAALGAGLISSSGVAWAFDRGVGVVIGALFVLAFIAFGGLDFERIKNDTRRRVAANEGIRRSLRNALLGVLTGGALGCLGGFFTAGFAGGLCGASLFSLVLGLFAGGHTCLQHLILRLLLCLNGYAPLNYVDFLEYAVDRVLLYRVGGGYLFVHRSLLEHFAGLHRPVSH